MFKKSITTFAVVAALSFANLSLASNEAPKENLMTLKVIPSEKLLQLTYEMSLPGLQQLAPELAKNLPTFNKADALGHLEVLSMISLVWQKSTQGTAIVAYVDANDKATAVLIQEIADNSDDIAFITIDKAQASQIVKDIFKVNNKPLFITYKDAKEVARAETLDKKELTKHIPKPDNIKTLEQLVKKGKAPQDIKAYLKTNAPELEKLATDNTLDAALFGAIAQEKKPVMVKFSASWCPPCKTMKPIVHEVAQQFVNDITIIEVTLDQSTQHLLQAFGAQGIPTFVFFKDNKKVDQFSGAIAKQDLVDKITKLIN